MTLPPSVLSAILSIVANPGLLTPDQSDQPSVITVNGATIQSLQTITGTYTPNNDTKVIAAGLAAASPNFIVLLCDGPAVLTSDNLMFKLLPVGKCLFASLLPLVPGGSPINTLTLDGTAANPYPMIQGTLLNYTLILGQAVLT